MGLQERGLERTRTPCQDQGAAAEVLTEEVAQDRLAPERLDGDTAALAHGHGTEDAQGSGLFEGAWKRGGCSEIEPADPQALGPGRLDQGREPLRPLLDAEEVGRAQGRASG